MNNDKRVGAHALVKDKKAEIHAPVKDKKAGTRVPVKDKKAETHVLVKDKKVETHAPVKVNKAGTHAPVKDNKAGTRAPVKVKICGLSRMEDIDAVNYLLPDYIGFVFAASKRRVTVEKAAELKDSLDPRIKAVGVFVNEDVETVAEIYKSGVIDLIQLHGDEGGDYILKLRELCGNGLSKSIACEHYGNSLGKSLASEHCSNSLRNSIDSPGASLYDNGYAPAGYALTKGGEGLYGLPPYNPHPRKAVIIKAIGVGDAMPPSLHTVGSAGAVKETGASSTQSVLPPPPPLDKADPADATKATEDGNTLLTLPPQRMGGQEPDFLLFDSLSLQRGGIGKPFDWGALEGYEWLPFFLAGGLTVENVEEAIKRLSPFCVDVSSGVESDGFKDAGKIAEFIRKVRATSTIKGNT